MRSVACVCHEMGQVKAAPGLPDAVMAVVMGLSLPDALIRFTWFPLQLFVRGCFDPAVIKLWFLRCRVVVGQ